jgi:hypothetical protein
MHFLSVVTFPEVNPSRLPGAISSLSKMGNQITRLLQIGRLYTAAFHSLRRENLRTEVWIAPKQFDTG